MSATSDEDSQTGTQKEMFPGMSAIDNRLLETKGCCSHWRASQISGSSPYLKAAIIRGVTMLEQRLPLCPHLRYLLPH